MRDHFTLGPTPVDEDCVCATEYEESRKEVKRYVELLKKIFGPTMPIGCSFRAKSFPHEMGSYSEACVFFDDEDNVGQEFMLHVESNLPQKWTDDKEVPFVAPKRERNPELDMEELEREANMLCGGTEFGD